MLSQRENFYNSRVLELGNYAYLDLRGLWGFYSSVVLTFVSWWKRCFLVEKILINTRILWDPLFVGISLIVVGRRTQDISILRFLETTYAMKVPRTCHIGATWLQQTISLGSIYLWGIQPSAVLYVHVMSTSTSSLVGRVLQSISFSDSVTNVYPHYLCPSAQGFYPYQFP